MRRLVIALSSLLGACAPSAEPDGVEQCVEPSAGWDQESVFEPSHEWAAGDVVRVVAGGAVVLGNLGDSAVHRRRHLRRHDTFGELVWADDGVDGEAGRALAVAPDGSVIVCDEAGVHVEHRLTRYAPDGEVIWSVTGADGCGGIALGESGVLMVGGTSEVSRFDLDGNALAGWPLELPGPILDIVADGDSLAVLGALSQRSSWVARINEQGTVAWLRETGSEDAEALAEGIAVADSGDIIAAGHGRGAEVETVGADPDAMLWRWSTAGDLVWSVVHDLDGGSERIRGVALTSIGKIVATGVVDTGVLVAGFDPNGSLEWWEAKVEGGHAHNASSIALDDCGSAYVTGDLRRDGWVGRFTLPTDDP